MHFYRASQSSARQPLLYQSGIIIIGQGRKVIHLGEHHVNYGAGDYLVVGVPLPLECEAFVEDEQAILGLSIDVPNAVLHELVNILAQNKRYSGPTKNQLACGLKSASLDEDLQLSYARVAKALTRVHQDYAQELSVDSLASEANMSVSAFHRAFRQVTLESPVQYVKKVRLVKARDLINYEGKKASEAALLVGYTSPSQFSREFKRHFNQSPSAA